MAIVRKKLVNRRPLAAIVAEREALEREHTAQLHRAEEDERWIMDEVRADPHWQGLGTMERMATMEKARRRQRQEAGVDNHQAYWDRKSALHKEAEQHPDTLAFVRVYLTQGEILALYEFLKEQGIDDDRYGVPDLCKGIVRDWMKRKGVAPAQGERS